MTSTTVYLQEVQFLQHIINFWWANRTVHERVDQVDIMAIFDRLSDRVQEVSSIWEYAIVLREELWNFGDGHLQLGPTFCQIERNFISNLNFSSVQEGVALARKYLPRTDNLTIDPEPGDLLVEIDGYPTETYLEGVRLRPGSTPAHRRWNAILSLSWQKRFPTEKPSPTEVVLRKPNGQHYALPVLWELASTNLPTPNCVRGNLIEAGIGYLELCTFCCRDELGQINDAEFLRQARYAISRVAGVDHLLVDLRRNAGGRDQQGQIAASLFTREPIEWFRYLHSLPYRDIHQLVPDRAYTNPEKWELPQAFSPQLWILIGPGCFSTSEVFASSLRYRGNVRFVGEPTGGGAGNPLDFRLPYTGLTITIPVSEFYMAGSDTHGIEASGIVPDLYVKQTAADLRADRDTIRDQILELLGNKRKIP